MDNVTLSKNNRLFWLGRYSERLYLGVSYLMNYEDQLIDNDELDYRDLCKRIGIDSNFADAKDFCRKYLFDRTLPESLSCTADAMLGNGMVLRETITSTTLSYLQMSVSAMDLAAKSTSEGIELQWVLDDIMAFRGSIEAFVDEEAVRNTIKCGESVEKLSTMLRFEEEPGVIRREMHKFLNRLYKTKLKRNEDHLELIMKYVFGEEGQPEHAELIKSVEAVFIV